MAIWQTPKTNWSAEDGVMNTDFNRIEGNIQYLKDQEVNLSAYMVAAPYTVYVSVNGSTSGDGTVSNPYRYLNQAIAAIPKNLGGHTVSIQITGSTSTSITSAVVNITGFSNGRLVLTAAGAGPNMYCSHNVTVSNGSILDITGFTMATFASGLAAAHNSLIYASCPITVSNSSLQANNFGNFVSSNNVTIASVAIGVYVTAGGHVNLPVTTINNTVQNGLWATDGGMISYAVVTNNATGVKVYTANGGRVYTGSQVSAPNY